MHRIKKLADEIHEELCSAGEYAECYIWYKASNDAKWASCFRQMANDELTHASHLHTLAVEEINMISNAYRPPQEMQDAWERTHREYVEKEARVRQMLNL